MEDKKKIKSFSKVLYVLAIIARVCIYIAGVVLVLCMITIPILFSKIEISNNKLAIPDLKVEAYKDQKDNLNIVYEGKKVDLDKDLSKSEKLVAELVYDKATRTTKGAVVGYLEAAMVFSLISIVLVSIAIKNFENFANNLSHKEEVFNADNPKYLRNTAKFLLISYIVSIISSVALSGIISSEFGVDFNTISVVEIIALYLLSYVFSYGHSLEAKKAPKKEEK